MRIADILSSGAQLQVDLLTALPDSSDPGTWQRPPFTNGGTFSAVAVVSIVSPVLFGDLSFDITPKLAAPCVVVAYGIRYRGQCVMVGPCSPFYLADGFPCVFRVSFAVYSWTQ